MFYISQILKNDCGFTALKILLANTFKDRNYLYLSHPKKKDVSYSFLDLINYSKDLGITVEGYKVKSKEKIKESKGKKFIANLNNNGSVHSVVVTAIKKDKVFVIDPAKGQEKISFDDFIYMWDGNILLVKTEERIKCPVKKNNFVSSKDKITLYLCQILGSLCFLIGLAFVNKGSNLVPPIILLCLFVVFEILMRSYSIIIMKKMDEKFYDENEPNDNNYTKYYSACESLKKNELVIGMNIINATFISVAGILILFINKKNNIYLILLSLIASMVYAFYIVPILKKKNQEIVTLEENIERDKFDNIRLLHDTGYNYGKISMLYKYLFIGLVIIVTLIIMAIENNYSVLFVLFNAAVTYLIYQNLNGIFLYNDAQEEYDCSYLKQDFYKKDNSLIESKED